MRIGKDIEQSGGAPLKWPGGAGLLPQGMSGRAVHDTIPERFSAINEREKESRVIHVGRRGWRGGGAGEVRALARRPPRSRRPTARRRSSCIAAAGKADKTRCKDEKYAAPAAAQWRARAPPQQRRVGSCRRRRGCRCSRRRWRRRNCSPPPAAGRPLLPLPAGPAGLLQVQGPPAGPGANPGGRRYWLPGCGSAMILARIVAFCSGLRQAQAWSGRRSNSFQSLRSSRSKVAPRMAS